MDQRLREVEGDVGTLKDWRSRTVDPWILSGKEFRETVGKFITRLESQEELRQQLNDERHKTNNFKLNFILALATIGLLLVAVASLYVSFQATRHSFVIFPDLRSYSSPAMTAATIVGPQGGALQSGDLNTTATAIVTLDNAGNWRLQDPQVSQPQPVPAEQPEEEDEQDDQ